jgi:long-chain acyl-CoA synthetase
MKGYWRLPEETAEAFTPDGWLRTGDIGLVLPSGHVRITGRKKEIVVTAGGKNVAPLHAETLLRTRCPYVSQVVLHGDRRPFCSALVTLDAPAATRWARDNDVPFADVADLSRRPEVHDLVQGYVDAVNRELPAYEQIRRFAILPEDFTQENGFLTPSLKVKRRAVEARWADVLDAFYDARKRTPVPARRRA